MKHHKHNSIQMQENTCNWGKWGELEDSADCLWFLHVQRLTVFESERS